MADILRDDVDRLQDHVPSVIRTAFACCAGGRPHNVRERAHRHRPRDGLPFIADGATFELHETIDLNSISQVNEETASARRMESNVLLSEVIALDTARIIALVVDKRTAACVASIRRMEYGASMEGAALAACIEAIPIIR